MAKVSAKISAKAPTKIDLLIGRNVRALRLAAGITLEQLGAHLGVTFQQIQKYENGTNRVGSGRLYQIAEIFDVPVIQFFDGAKTGVPPAKGQSPFDLLDDPLTLQMLREFQKISDDAIRRSVLVLVERMAHWL